MKFELEFTLTKIVAVLILTIGSVLSFYLKDSTAFITSSSTAAALMLGKTISDGFDRRSEIKYRQEPNVDTDH